MSEIDEARVSLPDRASGAAQLKAAIEADLGLDATRWFEPEGYESVAEAS